MNCPICNKPMEFQGYATTRPGREKLQFWCPTCVLSADITCPYGMGVSTTGASKQADLNLSNPASSTFIPGKHP